jgi:Zn-dependent M28 family amino/carboxypeptidase
VRYLSETIGEGYPSRPGTLPATTDYLRRNLQQAGYRVTEQTFQVNGEQVSNLEVIQPGDGDAGEVVVGAHYDSVAGAAGANDNGSGVAGVLELARLLREQAAEDAAFGTFRQRGAAILPDGRYG